MGLVYKNITDQLIENNRDYAAGRGAHRPQHPGKQPVRPARRVAVVSSSSPSSFFAFRGGIEPLDREHGREAQQRLEWDVRRSISAIVDHPWIPTSGPDAVSVRGFVYDVDTGLLSEVSASGSRGSIG